MLRDAPCAAAKARRWARSPALAAARTIRLLCIALVLAKYSVAPLYHRREQTRAQALCPTNPDHPQTPPFGRAADLGGQPAPACGCPAAAGGPGRHRAAATGAVEGRAGSPRARSAPR